ncbi:MAG: cell division protein SepF [Solobacterium sp.]|nr:cell division protein SepF [Solobacterium sp.]MBQ6221100.1 cell division protein SepF [Solobacterium sp.]MBR2668355.1 cell division protein SepF [Solobacterium sp.]
MGLMDKMKNFIAPADDEYEDDEVTEEIEYRPSETKPLSKYEETNNAKVRNTVNADTKMVLFEPRTLEEAEEIAAHLKQRQAVVVNLHRLQREYAQRTMDFLTGAVFALDGKIQKIGHNVILCSPKSIGVDGEISLDNGDE